MTKAQGWILIGSLNLFAYAQTGSMAIRWGFWFMAAITFFAAIVTSFAEEADVQQKGEKETP